MEPVPTKPTPEDCKTFPVGLCGNRDDHAPHLHDSTSFGRMWCEADQTKRLPFAMERRAAPYCKTTEETTKDAE